jgi:hypothetical protein
MTERRHVSQPTADDLIPESAVRRIAEERRAESELVMVTDLLKNVPELRLDPGAKVNDYIDGLVRRRAELLGQVGSASAARNVPAQPANSLVAKLGPFFTPWVAVNLPYFSEGVNQLPGVAGTQQELYTTALLPGGVEFEGAPVDMGTVEPNTPKWWVHTWTCSYVFPQALNRMWLYYRFTTETSFNIAAASARPNTGSLASAWISVGTTSDVETGGPFDPGASVQVAYPFFIPLPPATLPVNIDQEPAPVSGSIQVQAGKTAAIGLIYGTAVGIASGYLASLGGCMNTRLTLPSGTPYDGDPYDKIEYRFEPDWWVQAVNQRLKAAVTS